MGIVKNKKKKKLLEPFISEVKNKDKIVIS